MPAREAAENVARRLGCAVADAEHVVTRVLRGKTVDQPGAYLARIPDADLRTKLPAPPDTSPGPSTRSAPDHECDSGWLDRDAGVPCLICKPHLTRRTAS